MNRCVIYSSLQYFHNHSQNGKRPPENSGYDGIVGRNAGFGQTDLNVFNSFVMPENLILDFVYCNDKVCMTIGTDFILSAWALLRDG